MKVTETYKEILMKALNKLADKIDSAGDTDDDVLYKNSSEEVIASSLERIAENYESGKGVVRLYEDRSNYVSYKNNGSTADRVLWDDFIKMANDYVVRIWPIIPLGHSSSTSVPGECLAPATPTSDYVTLSALVQSSFEKDSVTYAWGFANMGITKKTTGGKTYAFFESYNTYLYGVPYPASDGGGASDNPNEPVPNEDPMVG